MYNNRYKGKEFIKGNIIYEGEYLFNKKWTGKIYDKKRNISYEIKNGNGIIKEYNKEYQLIYEGEYLDGKKWNGKAIYYENYDLLQFEIEYINGEINKNFVVKEFTYFSKILRFVGDYIYEEKYKNQNGYNKFSFNKEYFTGNGKEYYDNGKLKFEGEYLNGKKWNGKFFNIDKSTISEINNGKGFIQEYNDVGKIIFEGEYLEGKRNGKGKEYNQKEKLIFEGEYLEGKRNGNGKEFNQKGDVIFEGEYSDGERNGQGKEYEYENSIFSRLIFEGEYSNGERWDGQFFGDIYDYEKGFINAGHYKEGKFYIETNDNFGEFEKEEENEGE